MQDYPPTAIALRGITKHFGGVKALQDATFEVRPGEIHGLVGQNGAGKSTLIKILAGLHAPDAGTIEVGGHALRGLTPRKVEQQGIHFIHQDRLLVPSFTVGEALLLGQEATVHRMVPLLDRRAMRRKAAAILRDYFDLDLPPDALVHELSTAQKQIVQITRALLRKPSVVVFDEPTAALVKREADILFALIRRLRSEGMTFIYISHYLAEIEALCDRVTVLRNGRHVATVDPQRTPAAAIAALMVERDIAEMFPKRAVPIGAPVLKVTGLSSPGRFEDVGFEVRRGEIVGLTGLLGSGAKDLVRALFGIDRVVEGRIEIDGGALLSRSPSGAVGRGLALVPEDRRRNGVALDLDVGENMTLASLDRYSRLGLLRRRAERTEVDRLIRLLEIRTPGRETLVRHLSGGNQQKVALAKWLSRRSGLYILDEPTVGVDVGAKVEIYDLIGGLVEQAAGVLVLSSDLDELIGIADRILVMQRGRITRSFDPAATTPADLLAEVTGAAELRHAG